MLLKDIIDHLESFAPLQYQESYDNAGLITGNREMKIEGVLLCIDSIEEVVEEAVRKKCNLIIAHHPIVFSGIKKLNGKNYVERTIIKAIKNDIAIYAAHTNLDNVSNGVNAKIAEKLGLKNCKILASKTGLLRKLITFCPVDKAPEVRQALFAAGAGHIGNYDECSFNAEGFGTFRANMDGTNPYVGEKGKVHKENELKIEVIYPLDLEEKLLKALLQTHPYEEVAYDIIPLGNTFNAVGSGLVGELEQEMSESDFLIKTKQVFTVSCLRHTKFLGKNVKKVAVCGGSGSFLLQDAIKAGADVLVTADFKYHQFFDADNRIVIADIGHYESEQYTKELFYTIIKGKFPTFAVHFTEINTNPINYL